MSVMDYPDPDPEPDDVDEIVRKFMQGVEEMAAQWEQEMGGDPNDSDTKE